MSESNRSSLDGSARLRPQKSTSRSSSPPFRQPRNNAAGLPPTYLKHLRALLHQFLQQQVTVEPGLPGRSEERRIWESPNLEIVEKAIWEGVVVPRAVTIGRDTKGLLEVDWDDIARGSGARKSAWKKIHPRRNVEVVDNVPKTPAGTVKAKRKGSASDTESIRGRLSTFAPLSSMSTPTKGQSRAPSITSVSEKGKGKQVDGSVASATEGGDAEAQERARWYRTITSLPGYQGLHRSRRDEWDIVTDDFGEQSMDDMDLPGSFPQSGQYRSYGTSSSAKRPSRSGGYPSASPRGTPSKGSATPNSLSNTTTMLKAVYTIHFPPIPLTRSGSTSTLRLARSPSTGTESSTTHGSGTASGGWWGTGNRKWSDLTATGDDPLENLSMEFIEGRFALPTPEAASGRMNRSKSKTPIRSSPRGGDGDSSGAESSAGEGEDEASSAWSGTQHDTTRIIDRGETYILSGGEDDLPEENVARGEVGLVGGTIVVRGMRNSEEREALTKVMKIVIYTIQCMYLELSLRDVFQIPREEDTPPPPPPKPLQPKRLNSTPSIQNQDGRDLRRSRSHREKGERTKSFFHRLGKDTRGVFDSLLGRRTSSSGLGLDIPSSPPSPSLDEPSISIPGTQALASLGNPTAPLVSALRVETPPINHPTERYISMLQRLQDLKPSTTPGLTFPMPPILLRVQEEDRIRKEKAQQEVRDESGFQGGFGLGIDGLPGRNKQLENQDTLRGRALGYRLGGDVRSGLAALISGIDTFEGWEKLQKLDVLYCTGVEDVPLPVPTATDTGSLTIEGEVESKPPLPSPKEGCTTTLCQKPVVHSMTYYDPHTDITIGEYLQDLAEELGDGEIMEGCERSGCGYGLEGHWRSWIHGGKKITGQISRIADFPRSPIIAEHDRGVEGTPSTPDMARLEAEVWVSCQTCGEASSPRKLDELASQYSWSKFLELLLYSDVIAPPICSHNSPTYHLKISNYTLSLSRSNADVLDARMPKLQVGPNVPKRKAGKAVAEAAVEAIMKRDDKELCKQTTKQEVIAWVESVETALEALKPENTKEIDGKEPTTDDETIEVLKDGAMATKDNLFAQLDSISLGQLNDFRRQFVNAIEDMDSNIEGWRKRHPTDTAVNHSLVLPEYAKSTVHALPGSSVLIREDEPSSVIAYTLSTVAYFAELGVGKTAPPAASVAVEEPKTSDESTRPSNPACATRTWEVECRRKETQRDLLSLRALSKKRSEASIPSARAPMSLTPKGPSLELNLEQAEGQAQREDRLEEIVKTISKATKNEPLLTGIPGRRSPSISESETAATTSLSSSLLGDKGMSNSTASLPIANPFEALGRPRMQRKGSGDIPPPSAFKPRSISLASPTLTASAKLGTSTPPSSFRTMTPPSTVSVLHLATPSKESSKDKDRDNNSETWTSTWTSSFASLMKLPTELGDTITSRWKPSGDSRSLASIITGPLTSLGGLANMDTSLTNTPELPHIQFTYTLQDRWKLGCTVYFANSFDSLRRRCAVDRSFVKSLERTRVWKMQGGKSGAGWWMTVDGRFVVKELVSKWNVSDTQALLEISPAYFEHLASTHNRATALAKIVGFYTVKSHDLVNNVKTSMDLLVMENLFYKQNLDRTFDLKGIEARRVPKTSTGSTLFDGEWLDAQTKDPLLLHPHAKRILLDSLGSDTRFLTNQGIMDYSLLLGLDMQKKELVAGLVDAVGSFGLWKRLESAGKVGLRGKGREGEVTVIPPEQYRERFEHAMRTYFYACPDKWSRSPRRSGIPQDHLPSVF